MNPATSARPGHTSVVHGESRLVSLIGWIAVSIAVLVALSLPVGYFLVAYKSLGTEMTTTAKLHAAFVTQLVYVDSAGWHAGAGSLIETQLSPTSLPEVRVVVDPQGQVVASSTGDLAWPVESRSAAVQNAEGQILGEVLIRRTIRPLMQDTGLVALLGMALGLGVFISLRVLPLRVLQQVLGALRHERQQLAYLANYDALTSLPNRTLFRQRLEEAMARSDRDERQLALLFLDLDGFKNINDSLGHDVGDQLLQHVARLMVESLRKGDAVTRMTDEMVSSGETVVSRLGGDEFTVIAEALHSIEDAQVIANRVIEGLRQPFHHAGQDLHVTASIGITVYPDDRSDVDALIKHADTAMYRAKELGRNDYRFYTDDMNERARKRLTMEANLRQALEQNEFLLYYQPKIELASGRVTGVEALLRWRPPQGNLIAPGEFIPFLEETGLIVPVGEWVLVETCKQIKDWRARGVPVPHVAVNLSARQFRKKGYCLDVMALISRLGVEPSSLELEITEGLFMEHVESRIVMMSQMRAKGVTISIDDFGTGYSSLGYLRRLPIDTLKIDRSFVSDITTSDEAAAIVSAIIGLARSLRLGVVAEGVETEAQLALLRKLGCEQAQGYLFAHPMPAAALEAWLGQERHGAVKATR